MSDQSQGPGWWLASDGRWYPPEQHPEWVAPAPPTPAAPPPAGDALGGYRFEAPPGAEQSELEPTQGRRWSTWSPRSRRVAAGVALAVVAALIIGGLVIGRDDDDGGGSVLADRSTSTTVRRTTTTKDFFVEPTPSDFSLEVTLTDKQCFGSAGCSLHYRVDLTYTGLGGLAALQGHGPWTIIYSVEGDEDGSQVGSLELSGDGQYQDRERSMSTANDGVVPTATVTEVR